MGKVNIIKLPGAQETWIEDRRVSEYMPGSTFRKCALLCEDGVVRLGTAGFAATPGGRIQSQVQFEGRKKPFYGYATGGAKEPWTFSSKEVICSLQGIWIEQESVCQSPAQHVRSFAALCADGIVRTGKAAMAEFTTSIPAYIRPDRNQTINGHLHNEKGILVFIATGKDKGFFGGLTENRISNDLASPEELAANWQKGFQKEQNEAKKYNFIHRLRIDEAHEIYQWAKGKDFEVHFVEDNFQFSCGNKGNPYTLPLYGVAYRIKEPWQAGGVHLSELPGSPPIEIKISPGTALGVLTGKDLEQMKKVDDCLLVAKKCSTKGRTDA
jgi:hypothetical protein